MVATEDQRTDFAQRLQEARRNANLTQMDLAQQVGVTRAAVSEWEHGKSAPRTIDLAQLVDTAVGSGGMLMEALGFLSGRDQVAEFMAALEASVEAARQERIQRLDAIREQLGENNLQAIPINRWELDPDIDWFEVLASLPEHLRRGILEILDPYIEQWVDTVRQRHPRLRAAHTGEPDEPGPVQPRPRHGETPGE